jgi:hypothetical protein
MWFPACAYQDRAVKSCSIKAASPAWRSVISAMKSAVVRDETPYNSGRCCLLVVYLEDRGNTMCEACIDLCRAVLLSERSTIAGYER